MDITKCKRNIYAIVDINANKNLVYQSILVITRGSVLVILPIITFIEDQVCIALKI